MLLALTRHPDTPCDAVSRIEVNLARSAGGGMALRYVAIGDISRLNIPHRQPGGRADELWRTTCFEAFVRTDGGYAEINLSPSGRWAAYSFSGYREGDMAQLESVSLDHMTRRAGDGLFELVATLDLARVSGLSATGPWRLGLSAVIEETSGRKSYWALAQAPDKPDFHHPDSFACVLEPA